MKQKMAETITISRLFSAPSIEDWINEDRQCDNCSLVIFETLDELLDFEKDKIAPSSFFSMDYGAENRSEKW